MKPGLVGRLQNIGQILLKCNNIYLVLTVIRTLYNRDK